MLPKLVLVVVAVAYTANAAPLRLPTSLTRPAPEDWHNDELCPKLQKLLCKGAECTTFEDFFPSKSTGDFEFDQEGVKYTLAEYKTIVNNAKDKIGADTLSDATKAVEIQCKFVNCKDAAGQDCPASGTAPDGDYTIESLQKVICHLDQWQYLPLPDFSLTVSNQRVTYKFEWSASNDPPGKLLSTVMVNNNDPDSGTAFATLISSLNSRRRRLMEQESVKHLMRMPKVVIVPLISGMIVLLVVISAVLVWKSLCFCLCCEGRKNKESLDDVCRV